MSDVRLLSCAGWQVHARIRAHDSPRGSGRAGTRRPQAPGLRMLLEEENFWRMIVALWLAVLLAKKKLLHTTIVVDSRRSTHARIETRGENWEITCRRVVCTCPPFSHSSPACT